MKGEKEKGSDVSVRESGGVGCNLGRGMRIATVCLHYDVINFIKKKKKRHDQK